MLRAKGLSLCMRAEASPLGLLVVDLLANERCARHQPSLWHHEHGNAAAAELRGLGGTGLDDDTRGLGAESQPAATELAKSSHVPQHDELRERLTPELSPERGLVELGEAN